METPPDVHPLFILAPPRSYTSVACAMLGQHPAMYGLPEVNLFAADSVGELVDLFRSRPGLGHGLVRAVAELGLGDQTADSAAAALEWLATNRELPTDVAYADLAAWAAPRRLVDKSPLYGLREGCFQRIERSLPDARYLHLTRHPVTTIDSMIRFRRMVRERLGGRRERGSSRDAQDYERYWLAPHRAILDFLARIPADRQMRMRGEDLLAAPAERLRDIAAWLALDTGDAAVAAMMRPERSPYACEGPPAARYGNDPEFLSRPALRPPAQTRAAIEDDIPPTVADCAGQLGYTRPDNIENQSGPVRTPRPAM